MPIRGPEKFIGILSDQRRFIAPQQACETRIQLDDAAIAHDRKAVQCRVDETLEVDEIPVHERRGRGCGKDQECHAGNRADHDQPAEIVGVWSGNGRIGRENGGRHGSEMQRADCKDRRGGGKNDTLPGAEAVKQPEGEKKKRPGDGKTAKNSPPIVADRGGDIYSRHSDEMHDGNRERQQGGRNHRAVDCLRAGIERQPEAEYGKNGRESGEGKIETDGNSAFIGEHGHEMSGPDA